MRLIIAMICVAIIGLGGVWGWDWYKNKKLDDQHLIGSNVSAMTPQKIKKQKQSDLTHIPFMAMDWRLKMDQKARPPASTKWITFHARESALCIRNNPDRCYDVAIHAIAWPAAKPNKRKEFLALKNTYANACNVNYITACLYVALIFRYGDEADQNHEKSRKILSALCELPQGKNVKVACTELGRQLLSDFEKTPSKTHLEAIAVLEDSCNAFEPRACNILAHLYDETSTLIPELEKSAEKSLAYATKSCEIDAGNPWGCYQKSLRYAAGATKVDKDVYRGKLGLGMACNQGIRAACVASGQTSSEGTWQFDASIR